MSTAMQTATTALIKIEAHEKMCEHDRKEMLVVHEKLFHRIDVLAGRWFWAACCVVGLQFGVIGTLFAELFFT